MKERESERAPLPPSLPPFLKRLKRQPLAETKYQNQ